MLNSYIRGGSKHKFAPINSEHAYREKKALSHDRASPIHSAFRLAKISQELPYYLRNFPFVVNLVKATIFCAIRPAVNWKIARVKTAHECTKKYASQYSTEY